MIDRFRVFAGVNAFVSLNAACGSDEPPHCDPVSLQEALSRATPGDTISIGACTVSGTFEVPAGVTLAGQSSTSSKIVGAPAQPALRLVPGSPATTLRNLTVESQGQLAIIARGAGA